MLNLYRSIKGTTLRPILEHNNSKHAHKTFPSLFVNNFVTENVIPSMNASFLYLTSNHICTSVSLFAPVPPPKKAKRDPMQDRAREEKKKRRLAKALRKMDKKPRILKPMIELELDPKTFGGELKDKRERVVPLLSPSELEEKTEKHALLLKEWSRFSRRRHVSEIRQIDTVLMHRLKALEELRKVSHELYAEAIKPEIGTLNANSRIFYQAVGPTSTPPIRKSLQDDECEDWLVDGHYEEVTKTFLVQYGEHKSYMNKLLNKGKRIRKASAEDDD